METAIVFVRYVVRLDPTGPVVKARRMQVRLKRLGAIRYWAPLFFLYEERGAFWFAAWKTRCVKGIDFRPRAGHISVSGRELEGVFGKMCFNGRSALGDWAISSMEALHRNSVMLLSLHSFSLWLCSSHIMSVFSNWYSTSCLAILKEALHLLEVLTT